MEVRPRMVGPGDRVELLVVQNCDEPSVSKRGAQACEQRMHAAVVSGEFVSLTKLEGDDGNEYVIRTEAGAGVEPSSFSPDAFLWQRVDDSTWEHVGQVHRIDSVPE